MKKLLKVSMLLLGTSSAFAGGVSMQSSNSMMDGFYGGLGIGALSHSVDTKITGLVSIEENYGNTSAMGQIFLGYEYALTTDYGIRLEAFADYSNNSKTIGGGTPATSYKIKTNGTYGIKAMPFFQVSNSAKLFVDIGYASSSIKMEPPEFAVTAGAASSYSKSLTGLLLGAGSEVSLSNQLSVRGEYQYISYSAWKSERSTYATSHQPTASMFVASMVYKMA